MTVFAAAIIQLGKIDGDVINCCSHHVTLMYLTLQFRPARKAIGSIIINDVVHPIRMLHPHCDIVVVDVVVVCQAELVFNGEDIK